MAHCVRDRTRRGGAAIRRNQLSGKPHGVERGADFRCHYTHRKSRRNRRRGNGIAGCDGVGADIERDGKRKCRNGNQADDPRADIGHIGDKKTGSGAEQAGTFSDRACRSDAGGFGFGNQRFSDGNQTAAKSGTTERIERLLWWMGRAGSIEPDKQLGRPAGMVCPDE